MPDGPTPDIPITSGIEGGTGTPKTQVPVLDSGQTTPGGTGTSTYQERLEMERQALLAARGSGEPGQPGSNVPAGSVEEIVIGPVRELYDGTDNTEIPQSSVDIDGPDITIRGKLPRRRPSE